MKQKNTKKIVIAVVALVALIAVLLGVYLVNRPGTSSGTKHITLEVVDDQGQSTEYEADTDAEYLRGAFDDFDGLTVEGSESDYGLYIETVNGVTADYDADGAYWSIYVNGEYGQYGADEQPVTDGDAYQLVYEVYEN